MEEQKFFDINKFPKGWGLIVFPISMTRISNSQSAQAYLEYLRFFTAKVAEPRIGIHFLYTEGLYMNMPGKAYEIKNSYAASAIAHANAFRRLLKKHYLEFQIHDAFSFDSWFQMYLLHPDFLNARRSIEKFYDKDKAFQKLAKEDAEENGKEFNEYQRSFFLEEHTLAYLLLNGEIKMRNHFVDGRESWILLAYPGLPLKSQIYLFQKDPLKIGGFNNPYKGQYDLVTKKFIDYQKVDLDTFNSK
ncbi:MAG: hypothetical protein HYT93_03475 [Parcubacteria group bacterium]|nr:hypothetical protein [Parcubacteria group bacterium]